MALYGCRTRCASLCRCVGLAPELNDDVCTQWGEGGRARTASFGAYRTSDVPRWTAPDALSRRPRRTKRRSRRICGGSPAVGPRRHRGTGPDPGRTLDPMIRAFRSRTLADSSESGRVSFPGADLIFERIEARGYRPSLFGNWEGRVRHLPICDRVFSRSRRGASASRSLGRHGGGVPITGLPARSANPQYQAAISRSRFGLSSCDCSSSVRLAPAEWRCIKGRQDLDWRFIGA